MGNRATMWKKMIAGVICAVIGVHGFASAAKDAPGNDSVRVLAAVSGGKDDAENELFQAALEKALGFRIVWEKPLSYDQVLIQKLGAGEVLDMIYLGQTQMYSLVDQGVLQDLTARLKGSAVIQANYPPGELDKIAYNGKYYAGFNKLEVFTLPNVNKAITDKAGVDLAALSTLDDYHAMLTTVKAYMENTEGKKPYYPFFLYMTDVWDLQPWFSSAGLRRGVFVDAAGRKTAPWVTDAAVPVWAWLAKCYADGLIDPMSLSGKTSDMRAKLWQSREIVMDSDWVAWTGLYNNNAKVAGDYPERVNVVGLPGVKSPSGKYLLEQGGASLWGIPVNAKNPDKAFKIIEYFATKEGALLLTAGIEGHDYTVNNGKITLTDTGVTHAKDHGAPFPISTQFDLNTLGAMNPGVAESYAIGKRPDVAVEPMGYANGALDSRQFYDILAKWMTECLTARLDPPTAIQNAAAELRSKRIID